MARRRANSSAVQSKTQKEMNYLRRLAAIAARVMTDKHARCASGDDSEV